MRARRETQQLTELNPSGLPAEICVPVPDWACELFPRAPLLFVHAGDHVYKYIHSTMTVLCSARVEQDGRRWMHVSVSRPSRLPSWDDLRLVKDTFIGRERKAIQVLPPASEHVNTHPYCLHMFACLDGDVLPDFRNADGSL